MSLRIGSISHRFGSQEALRDVSITVERGDCYGFIGHNGAGKTTAMRIMLGLLRPDAGQVLIDGFDAARHPREARARMGALIETPGFHGSWSGRANLALLDRLGGGRSDLDGLLDLVGLGGVGSKPVRAYSQGMRQRLGVAQALLGDPPYVLLDEPTNGLDPDGIREMRALLLRLTRTENKTVFLSSHQLHELAGLCNRVGVLREGRLVLEEHVEHLLAADRYTIRTDDDARAEAALAAHGCEVRRDGALTARLGDRAPAAVLKALVDEGLEVVEYAPRKATLEEIYHREAAPPARNDRAAPLPPDPGPPSARVAPPRPIARMLGHEARRWGRASAVPLLLALPAAIGGLAIYLRWQQWRADLGLVAAGEVATVTDVTAFEGVARAMHGGVWLLCYIVLGIASQSVAGELSQGTLRNVVLRPVTRLQVALGKGLAVLGAALLAYLMLAGTAVAGAALAFDFVGVNEVLPNGKVFPLVPADELWPDFHAMLLSPLLPIAAYAAIGFLAGALVRRGATALALALGAGFLLDLGRDFARGSTLEAWFPPTYVPSLGRTSFIDYFRDAAQGVSNTFYRFAETDAIVPLAWTAAAFGLAAILFRRRYIP